MFSLSQSQHKLLHRAHCCLRRSHYSGSACLQQRRRCNCQLFFFYYFFSSFNICFIFLNRDERRKWAANERPPQAPGCRESRAECRAGGGRAGDVAPSLEGKTPGGGSKQEG